ncbi:hypothetical protein AB0I81_22750 [Nonomuraea sp. NPDC050404]|uniref:hypothetical protein n=1 Tax=Nonomuraea sp. NPDC050404 TaxID=3155783 RepID=UPI0033D6B4F0
MRCSHAGAVLVESVVTGEVLAMLCPECDRQLPPTFANCPHDNVIDTPEFGEPPGLGICNDCGVSAWYPSELDRRTRVLAARYGVQYMPYVASLDAPTRGELNA